MPKCPGNGTVIVEAGDNLWKVSKFVLQYEGNANPTNTQIANLSNKIAKINNIQNTNLIYAGQVFKVYENAGGSGSSGSSGTGNTSNSPVITSMGIQSGTDRTVFATWTWHKHDTTKEYKYEYYYDTGDSLEWFYGGGGSCETRQHATFTPPENAKRVKFMVKPIAKSKEAK